MLDDVPSRAAAVVVAGLMFSACSALAAPAPDRAAIDRGRYLVRIMGCNDCHTAGYAGSAGKTPEAQWLTGDAVGWRGPWGTTYASNLRLLIDGMTEAQWIKLARTAEYRPPMPWFTLRDTRTQDLRDMYRFIKSLGPAGQAMPAYVPPDKTPAGPVIQFPAPPAK